MSLSALIRRMAEAGAPPEAIALAVEAVEAVTIRRVLDMPSDECRVTVRPLLPETVEAA